MHRPDGDTRRMVSELAGVGIRQDEIARIIGIDSRTLRKHYNDELDNAAVKKNLEVANRLYEKALEGDVASMIFWLKTRARWKDTQQHDVNHSGDIKVKYVKPDSNT